MTIVVTTTGLSGSSISSYSALKTAVAAWLNRTDLTDRIPDFISLGEAKLNSDLDNIRSMEAKNTLYTTAGVSYVGLPVDLLEIKRVQVLDSFNQVLEYRSPDELSADYESNQTGRPAVFTVVGGNMELAPIPDAVYAVELTYFQRLAALSDTNTTNWLLTSWPNAYLYAALVAAQPFIMADPRLATFEALYKQAVQGINNIDWFSGSTMRVRAR